MGKVEDHKCHCHDLLGKLGDFLDGEADAECCVQFENHMEICEKCSIVIKTLRTTMKVCHDHINEDLPDMVSIRVRRVVWERLIQERIIDEKHE
jgi:hypothetical protein